MPKKIAIYFIHLASLTYPCSLKLFALKPFDRANITVIESTARLKLPFTTNMMAAILKKATSMEDIHFVFIHLPPKKIEATNRLDICSFMNLLYPDDPNNIFSQYMFGKLITHR